MATLSQISVSFIANTAAFTAGLTGMRNDSVKFSKGLKKDLGAAGQDLKEIGKVAALAGAALYTGLAIGVAKSIEEISKIKDEADKIGVSAQAFMALGYAAKTTGSDVETVKRSFVELQKSTNDAAAGNQATVDSFGKLGINIDRFKQLKPEEQFRVMVDAIGKVTDKTDQSTIGFNVFGKTFTELKPIINGGLTGLQAAAQEAANVGQSLSNVDVTNVKALGEGFEWIGNAVQGAFNMIAASVAPVLNPLIEDFKTWANTGSNFADTITTGLTALVTPIYMAIRGFEFLMAAVKTIQSGMAGMMAVGLNSFGGLVKGVNAFCQLFVFDMNLIVKAWNLLPFTSKVSEFKFEGLDGAIKEIDAWTEGAVQTMKDYWSEAGEYAGGKFSEKFLDKFASPIINGVAGVAKRAGEAAVTGTTGGKPTLPDVTETDAEKNLRINNKVSKELDTFFAGLDKKSSANIEAINRKYESIAESIRANLMTPEDELKAKLAEVDDAYAHRAITIDEQIKATRMLKAEYFMFYTELGRATQTFTDGFAEGFVSMLRSGEDFGKGLKNLFTQLFAEIAMEWLKLQIKMMVGKMITSLGMSLAGSFAGGFGGAAGQGTGFEAGSNAAYNAGQGSADFWAGRASGGPVKADTPYIVGEVGQELFVPRTAGTIIPNSKLNSFGGNAPTVNYNMYSYDTVGMQEMIDKNRPRLAQDSILAWRSANSRRK